MLPPVIREGEFHPFKFWFNDTIQDGMFYRNEMFYRLKTVADARRVKLYQEACRLAQRSNFVVVSVSTNHYSLWVSLRSPELSRLARYHRPSISSL